VSVFKWTIPPAIADAMKADPSGVPDRVTQFLTGKGYTVNGVTVRNRDTLSTPEGGVTYIDGPFLVVDADRDPRSDLSTVTPEQIRGVTVKEKLLSDLDQVTTVAQMKTYLATRIIPAIARD